MTDKHETMTIDGRRYLTIHKMYPKPLDRQMVQAQLAAYRYATRDKQGECTCETDGYCGVCR